VLIFTWTCSAGCFRDVGAWANRLHALFAFLAAIVDGGAARVHSSAEMGIYIRTMELLSGMRASGLGQNKVSIFEPQ
jgi:hypothetical protein